MVFILAVLLISMIFLEGTITTLPLVLIFLLCLTIVKRDASIFAVAFFAGLLFDSLTVRIVGGTSLFLVLFVFVILLYQRKYEINSYPFVAVAAFIGSWIFLLIYGYGNIFWQSVISSFISLILFWTLRHRERHKERGDPMLPIKLRGLLRRSSSQ